MANLKTTYLGIELKNPIIVGSCSLTATVESAKRMEAAGAGAIVTKSLFEEQIQLESFEFEQELREYENLNPEISNIFPKIKHAGPEEHLMRVRQIKEAVNIPVIGSLNAIYNETWVEYAKLMEQTGVDALELNFYHLPKDPELDSIKIIDSQLEALYKIKSRAKIPVSIKLSPYYTNILRAVNRMNKVGVDGFVLFNRLFQPNIDIEKEQLIQDFNFSNSEDYKLSLRYVGLLYKKVKADLLGNTGIYDGKDVIKMLLAGANGVQVVSTLYKNHPEHIASMLTEITEWMDRKGYESISDFNGKLAKVNLKDPFAYNRAQYISILMNAAEYLKKFL